MSRASGLTQNATVRIWRVFGLKPHSEENFKLSTDPFLVENVRDIVGLYLDPPAQTRAIVLCLGEVQIQAPVRNQPIVPLLPGQPGRRMHDYYRHGTAPFFIAWILPPAKSSAAATRGTATKSSYAACNNSTGMFVPGLPKNRDHPKNRRSEAARSLQRWFRDLPVCNELASRGWSDSRLVTRRRSSVPNVSRSTPIGMSVGSSMLPRPSRQLTANAVLVLSAHLRRSLSLLMVGLAVAPAAFMA